MSKVIVPALLLLAACTPPKLAVPTTEVLQSPTKSLLQAISLPEDGSVWMSGHQGQFIRSTDNGDNWILTKHPTADSLEFRDIHALNSEQAILMSAGPGALSSIFQFTAPDKWERTFVMEDSLGFLDCIDFWDDKRGIAYGDAIDKFPYILLTSDGGLSWNRADSTSMPVAGVGEGGFAASGTCVTTGKNGKAWIATGASGNCRFLLTEDYGKTWSTVASPIVTGEAAGNTTVTFSGSTGIAAGGDLAISDAYTDNVAISTDMGLTWNLTGQPVTLGAFYGSAITKLENKHYAFVCGPNGIDYSKDLGLSWSNLDSANYWAVGINGNVGYAAGKNGRILKIVLPE